MNGLQATNETCRIDGMLPYTEIDNVLTDVLKTAQIIKNNKQIIYYNIPSAFDIETSSFYQDTEKKAIMYIWMFGIDNYVLYGRTWDEFLYLYDRVVERMQLTENVRLYVAVHNLGYEFQFLRKWLKWKSVFSVSERKPVYALTEDGVEFRCTYILSGLSLSNIGKELKKYPVEKMVGDLDYKLIRHSKTPLTDKELKYCENDIRVLLAYIREKIENDGDITRIPLTKTGYIRRLCRNACLYEGKHDKNPQKFINYMNLMKRLQIDRPTYEQAKRVFAGGFTHANAHYVGKVVENVRSFDECSAYPAAMVAFKYPMSSGELYDIENKADFEKQLSLYCCMFDCEFFNLESIVGFDHIISKSKCVKIENYVEDNGRIVSADYIALSLTEQDYYSITLFYKWSSMNVFNFRRFRRGYLPTDFVKCVLQLYKDKTCFKGVNDEAAAYSKTLLNATYGMMVTDIVRNEIKYDNDEWKILQNNEIEKTLEKYNKSRNRFTFYLWGVWVTAYNRRRILNAIYNFGYDYRYTDTDSIKAVNAEKHIDYLNECNQIITEQLKTACDYHQIDYSYIAPQNSKGDTFPLGIFEDEGEYSKFKTLGAKRYIYEKNEKIQLTVSGVNKHTALPYLASKYTNIFKAFTDELYIPNHNNLNKKIYTENGVEIDNPCGKQTHTYIDEEISGKITDYLGNTFQYYEKSYIHLEAADYTMSLSDAFCDYLFNIGNFENERG